MLRRAERRRGLRAVLSNQTSELRTPRYAGPKTRGPTDFAAFELTKPARL